MLNDTSIMEMIEENDLQIKPVLKTNTNISLIKKPSTSYTLTTTPNSMYDSQLQQQLSLNENEIDQNKTAIQTPTQPHQRNQPQHSRNSCKKLKCPKCNWHYKYRETLGIHMKEKHSDSVLKCIYCLEHTQHPRLGRGEQYKCGYKPYSCEICDYSTTTKGNLSIHMQSDKHLNNVKEGKSSSSSSGAFNPSLIESMNNESNSSSMTSSQDNKDVYFSPIVEDIPKTLKTVNEANKTHVNTKQSHKVQQANAIIKQLSDKISKSNDQIPVNESNIKNENDNFNFICQLCQVEYSYQNELEKHLINIHNVKNDDILKKLSTPTTSQSTKPCTSNNTITNDLTTNSKKYKTKESTIDYNNNENNRVSPEFTSTKQTTPTTSNGFNSSITNSDNNTNAAQLKFLQMLIQQSVAAYQQSTNQQSVAAYQQSTNQQSSSTTKNDFLNYLPLFNNELNKRDNDDDDDVDGDKNNCHHQSNNLLQLKNNSKKIFKRLLIDIGLQMVKHYNNMNNGTSNSSSTIKQEQSEVGQNRLDSVNEDEDSDTFKCSYCADKFNDILVLKIHLEEEHNKTLESENILGLTAKFIENILQTIEQNDRVDNTQLLSQAITPATSSASLFNPIALLNPLLMPFMYDSENNNKTVGSTPAPMATPSVEPANGQDSNRRKRTRITEEQLKVLRDHFDINKSPCDDAIQDIAHKTQLSAKVIKHWFRNTLFKERQKDKDSPYNFNNPPVTHLNLEEYEKTGKVNLSQRDDDCLDLVTQTAVIEPVEEEEQEEQVDSRAFVHDGDEEVDEEEEDVEDESEEKMRENTQMINTEYATAGSTTSTSHMPNQSDSDIYYYYNEDNSNQDTTSSVENFKLNDDNENGCQGAGGHRHSSETMTAGSGHNNSKRTNRTKFTDVQIRRLTKVFKTLRYPKDDEIYKLSKELGLNQRVITVWFQNSRQKERKCGNSTLTQMGQNRQEKLNGDDDDNNKDNEYDDNMGEVGGGEEDDNETDLVENPLHIEDYNCAASSTTTTTTSEAALTATTPTHLMDQQFQIDPQQAFRLAMDLYTKYKTGEQQLQQQQSNGDLRASFNQSEDDENLYTNKSESDGDGNGGDSIMSDSRRSSPTQYLNEDYILMSDKSIDTKRLRTTILPEQQDFLMQKYQIDQNPSRKMLEEIAKEVHLKKRVVQVWFQNTRARERKGIIKVTQQAICKRCTYCGVVFRVRSAMESHLIMKHGELVSKDNLNIDAFPDVSDSELLNNGVSKSTSSGNVSNVSITSGSSGSGKTTSKSAEDGAMAKTTSVQQSVQAALKATPLSSPACTMSPVIQTTPPQPPVVPQLPQPDNFAQIYNSMFPFANFANPFANPYLSSFLPQAHLASLMQQQFKQQFSQMPIQASAMAQQQQNIQEHDSEDTPLDLSGFGNGNKLNEFKQQKPQHNLMAIKSNLTAAAQHRRIRTQMSQFQVNIMKCLFMEYKTPTMIECEMLGREIGLKKRVVQVWFQNARAKEKKNPKCLRVDVLNYEYSNDMCAVCGNVAYVNIAQQREHLFTKQHLNKLTQYLQSNLLLSNSTTAPMSGSYSKRNSNSPMSSYADDSDNDDYVDYDEAGDDNDDGASTVTMTNKSLTKMHDPSQLARSASAFDINSVLALPQQQQQQQTQMNQFQAALQALSSVANQHQQQQTTNDQQNLYNFLMYSNLFQNPQAQEFLLQQQQQQAQSQPFHSLGLTTEATAYVTAKLKDNFNFIEFTNDGSLSNFSKLKKLNYDLCDVMEKRYYLCKLCSFVWSNKDAFKSHPCCATRGDCTSVQVKLEHLKYKCVPCDMAFLRIQEFLEHTTKHSHLDNCIRKRKTSEAAVSAGPATSTPMKKIKS